MSDLTLLGKFSSVGHAIMSLNPKITEIDASKKKRQYPLERIKNAYFYFRKTNKGSGLVELAVLLEDEETGWLPEILNVIDSRAYYKLNKLINDMGLDKFVDGSLIKRLNFFRNKRDDCAHELVVEKALIESAFLDFLIFAQWYYQKYHKTELFDKNLYSTPIPIGNMLCDRFKVIDILSHGDEHSQTYQVEDILGPKGNYFFTAKRVLISSPNYDEILKNEKESRPLFNDNPYIGRFYSSHNEVPVGEVLLLEYIDAWTLEKWLSDEHKNRISSDVLYELVYVIGGVLRALRAIHDQKYVHGYVTPQSILVTRKTKDARLVSFDRCTLSTTPFSKREKEYRSHEKYNPKYIDEVGRSPILDTFAVGQILKEILDSDPYIIAAKVPVSLLEMVNKATSQSNKKRYQSAKEMYDDWTKAHNDIRYERLAKNPRKNVALISCSNRKLDGTHPARELYSASDNFVSALKFAENPRNKFDQLYILSGRHGLVEPDQILQKYDFDLKELSGEEKAAWATHITSILRTKIDSNNTTVTIFADKTYSACLLTAFANKIKATRNPDFFQL